MSYLIKTKAETEAVPRKRNQPMLANNNSSPAPPSSEPFSCLETGINNNKRKRRPAGTPDPDAEVVSLSPKTLLESDRYVCEICNQGFQRDQNLQMHRRRHKVPWKLVKREATTTPAVRKRVFVCPEPTCLHHDPCHALGDLVGIKKHFRRKHSNHKQWVCQRCSKGYAVQSDYKAHLKTCGTRGHSCDCGRVFSRVESFIEHQDSCNPGRLRSDSQSLQPVCLSRAGSSSSTSSDTNFSTTPWQPLLVTPKPKTGAVFFTPNSTVDKNKIDYNLDLQLSTTSSAPEAPVSPKRNDNHPTRLELSIGWASNDPNMTYTTRDSGESSHMESNNNGEKHLSESRIIIEQAREQFRQVMAERAYAEDARQHAKRQLELAEQEFANAKGIRQKALAELGKAQALKDHAIKQINSTILEITCHTCKQQFQARNPR